MLRLRPRLLSTVFFTVVTTIALSSATPAFAQPLGSARAWSVTAGVDFPTVYIFRGIVQNYPVHEGDHTLTMTPHADVDVKLTDSGSVRAGASTWNSFNTGTSGSGGPLDSAYSVAQFTGRVSVALANGLTITPSFFINTSPNDGYDPIREIDVTVAHNGRYAPYAMVAFELSDSGQLDEGQKKGRYLEVGATPRWGRRRIVLSIPVKAGFSVGDYYELLGRDLTFTDHKFGFVEGGARLMVPLGSRFGAWSVVGGADVYVFGDATRAFNLGDKYRAVGTIGVAYRH